MYINILLINREPHGSLVLSDCTNRNGVCHPQVRLQSETHLTAGCGLFSSYTYWSIHIRGPAFYGEFSGEIRFIRPCCRKASRKIRSHNCIKWQTAFDTTHCHQRIFVIFYKEKAKWEKLNTSVILSMFRSGYFPNEYYSWPFTGMIAVPVFETREDEPDNPLHWSLRKPTTTKTEKVVGNDARLVIGTELIFGFVILLGPMKTFPLWSMLAKREDSERKVCSSLLNYGPYKLSLHHDSILAQRKR